MFSPECPKRVDGNAPAVVGFSGLAGDFRVRTEGELARGVAAQALVVKRGIRIPFREVVDVRLDAAVAAGGAGEILVGALPAAVGLAVP